MTGALFAGMSLALSGLAFILWSLRRENAKEIAGIDREMARIDTALAGLDRDDKGVEFLVETMDVLVDGGAETLPVSAREYRMFLAYLQSQQQFLDTDTSGRVLYRDVPLEKVGHG